MNTGRPRNPFSSHLVEPARGGYIFKPGVLETVAQAEDIPAIIANLERHHWRGELAGPHGAGKSTLLTDIIQHLTARGLLVARWQCSDNRRTLPSQWRSQMRQYDVLAIDGAERLWPWLRWILRAETRLQGKGLLITTHRRLNLGAYVPVRTNPAALAEKIARLTGQPVSHTEVERRLAQHDQNAREVLFDLYMEFENRNL